MRQFDQFSDTDGLKAFCLTAADPYCSMSGPQPQLPEDGRGPWSCLCVRRGPFQDRDRVSQIPSNPAQHNFWELWTMRKCRIAASLITHELIEPHSLTHTQMAWRGGRAPEQLKAARTPLSRARPRTGRSCERASYDKWSEQRSEAHVWITDSASQPRCLGVCSAAPPTTLNGFGENLTPPLLSNNTIFCRT